MQAWQIKSWTIQNH